jgi:hypothetical protein
VSDLSSPPLPAWICKRDGRLVPFEPDRMCQALFAASEALGRPDAFLARELADSVLHFLIAEAAGSVPTTAQAAEVTAKVVRELGHPALARAYEAGRQTSVRKRAAPLPGVAFQFAPTDPPDLVAAACLREYSRHVVFSRDLVSAQADGLLTLAGLDAPLGLAGCVLTPPSGTPRGLVERLAEARPLAGAFVALDGPDHTLGRQAGAANFAQELGRGLRATRLRALVNLGCAAPPAWAEEGPGGPLFAQLVVPPPGVDTPGSPRTPGAYAPGSVAVEELLTGILEDEELRRRTVILWHLGEQDFGKSRAKPGPGLLHAARATAAGASITFVFDRPRRPLILGPGLDRRHPAVLLAVGLHLPCLADLIGPGGEPELFLRKLASLSRLALSAGRQKRAFLRRYGGDAVGRGFLPDRAHLVVVPVGLDAAVRRLSGGGLCDNKASLELGCQIISRLAEVLWTEGTSAGLEVFLDGTGGVMSEWERDLSASLASPTEAAGLTACDPASPPRQQLRAAGALHGLTGRGTAAVFLTSPSAETVMDLLSFAWRQTETAAVRFLSAGQAEQRMLPGLT